MKLITRFFVVMVAISFSQLAVAREALLEAAIKDIKVTSITPAVQEQLNKASPEDRKSLEAAIRTGNLFIPQYFSGNVYDSDPENKDWEKEVEPLISLDREEWEQQYRHLLKMNTKDISSGKNHAYSYRLTCPQVALISVQQDDDTTTLLYRTISVGVGIDHLDFLDINLEGAGEVYDVRVKLDKSSSLVDEVIPPDQWITESYTKTIALMKEFLADRRTAHTTKEHGEEMAKIYQSSIQTIENSAAKLCK